MRKKTVALLVPTLYNGGAEKVAADMSILLSNAGFKVVFFLEQFNRRKCYQHKGREVVVGAGSAWYSGTQIRQIYLCLKRADKYKKYKRIYHVDISISFMIQENLTNILSDIGEKKILTFHSVTSLVKNYKGQLFVNPYIVRKIYKKADAIVAVSEYVKWDLEQNMGMQRGIAKVIYNSIDINAMKRLGKEPLEEGLYENLILYIGRLDDEKRPWIAVRAMKEIVRNYSNAKLLVLGNGKNKSLLVDIIRKMNLEDHVKLMGFQENVAKFMAHAKLLMICSESEAFPCTMLEAMSIGLPIVANDCPGGIREALSFENKISGISCMQNVVVDCGILTPPIVTNKRECCNIELSRDEITFAQGVCMLLENEKLRIQMSQRAMKRVKKFSRNKIKGQWLELIESI